MNNEASQKLQKAVGAERESRAEAWTVVHNWVNECSLSAQVSRKSRALLIGRIRKALARCANEARLEGAKPLHEALTSINPFSAGRDGDQCNWCRRDYPSNAKEFKDYIAEDNHNADCELIIALQHFAELERAVAGIDAAPVGDKSRALKAAPLDQKGGPHAT